MIKKYWLVGTILLLSVVLVACNGGEATDVGNSGEMTNSELEAGIENENEGDQLESEVYPLTIQHAKGEEVIHEKPERVAIIFEWFNTDNLLSLDIEPIAMTNDPAWYGNDLGIASYLVDELEGIELLGSRESADVEKLTLANPDLILSVNVPFLDKQYDQFKQIAPTLMLDNYRGDWKDYHRQIAAIFGKEKEAEETIQRLEEKAQHARQELEGSIGEDSLAVVQLLPKTIRLYAQDGINELLYDDLGITPVPEAVQAQGVEEISLESLADINPDRILLYWTQAEELAEIEKSGVWQGLKAVQNGNVYFPERTVEWNPHAPIGRDVLLDQIVETFRAN
ncbi:iron-siderophore ABC transporter substrate-binding protein [Bacillus horti]|uniref:Iron complex transport system substrate-binding protein n=1 Tax=Caldalkalibacillus horti TaxID=77523 RepID=A0ABT9VVR3_9BACI|nr:iron-siderophore ABC transporter substrate-binding protein [Bacillus horti]MDQ0164974.1 iron complex transport system substrate-binding protein [Bacillus horti]